MVMRRQGMQPPQTILVENTGRSSSAHPFSRRFSPIAADPVLLDAVDEDVPGNVEIGGGLGDVPPFQAEGAVGASTTSGGTEISRSGLISFMKCSARGGMSSGLSLKGGTRISTTFSRKYRTSPNVPSPLR